MIGPILRDPQTQLLSCLDFIVVAVKLSTCKFETFQHLLKKAGNSGPLIPMVTTACWTWVANCHLSGVTSNAPAPSPIETWVSVIIYNFPYAVALLTLPPSVFLQPFKFVTLGFYHYIPISCFVSASLSFTDRDRKWLRTPAAPLLRSESPTRMEKYLIHFIAIIHPTQQHLIMARPVDDKAK